MSLRWCLGKHPLSKHFCLPQASFLDLCGFLLCCTSLPKCLSTAQELKEHLSAVVVTVGQCQSAVTLGNRVFSGKEIINTASPQPQGKTACGLKLFSPQQFPSLGLKQQKRKGSPWHLGPGATLKEGTSPAEQVQH